MKSSEAHEANISEEIMIRTRKVKRNIALSTTSFLAAITCAAGPVWAQTETPAKAGEETAAPADTPLPQSGTDSAAADSSEPDTSEIVVTGSSIRGVPPTGSNLISVTREDIRTVGAATT